MVDDHHHHYVFHTRYIDYSLDSRVIDVNIRYSTFSSYCVQLLIQMQVKVDDYHHNIVHHVPIAMINCNRKKFFVPLYQV